MASSYFHSLRFEAERCDGCMSCLRACPTAAIRVRHSRAVMLEDRCIDCGACITACPAGAVVPLTDSMAQLAKFELTVAVPSPALYAQFEPEVSTAAIRAALEQCGFDDAATLSGACDAVTAATEMYLASYRGQYPLISSFCPTVVRMVQVNYPDLVEQLLPIVAPRELTAAAAKERIARERGVPEERIGAVYITPCPAKLVAIADHPGMERSHLDAAVSISDLYHLLAAAVARGRPVRQEPEEPETASGMSWAFLGGFPASLPAENSLSVAGLADVIRILDDVEKGRLRRYAFIECHACSEGCVSGPLTVENPYVARAKAIRRMRTLPAGPATDRRELEASWARGGLLLGSTPGVRPLRPLDEDITKAIVKMKEKERIAASLPGIDCGACGAPSCGAFAQDVVLGEAEEDDCVFLWHRELVDGVERLADVLRKQRLPRGRHS